MTKGRARSVPGRSAGPTSIRLPSELSEFLRSKATQRQISVASVILQLVQNWKDDEEHQVWQGHEVMFCDSCRPHLVEMLYRNVSGRYQRRYNTPPLAGIEDNGQV